jgi:tripartite-type tricarboxylate transporter receptor subunit TctC
MPHRYGLILGACVAGMLPLLAFPAMSQPWPQRTVKLILPLGPGSGADIGARLFADRLQKRWGQPVVVENRPGGDSMVAIGGFIEADDGHTFFWGPSSSFVGHPWLHPKLSYDPKELVPLVRITNTIVTLVVPTALNIGTMADLVALIRKEPGKLNWATITGLNDLLFRSFLKSADLDMKRVPYRDPVQALNDASEGRIQVYSAAYAITRPQVQAGKVKVIALINSRRADMLPDVPTIREAGFPANEFDGLVGLFVRPSTPSEVREKLTTDFKATIVDPEITNRLTATGQIVNFGGPKEFAAQIEEQRARAAAAGKTLGIIEAR